MREKLVIQTRSDDEDVELELLLDVEDNEAATAAAAAVDPAECVGSILTNAGFLTDKSPMSSNDMV